jgi:[histone H3]-lysine9 N-trimethyltransferase EHMT
LNKLAKNNHSVDDPILMFPGKLPQRWKEWGNSITQVLPGYQLPKTEYKPDLSSFVMDMTLGRNVGCYLSNSRAPNMFVQFVMFDHQDMTCPHVMIFALQDIPPMTELTLDYGFGAI